MRLPESARARRRLLWSAGAGSLLVIGLAIALLMPSSKGANPEPTVDEGPAQLAVDTKGRLSAADRREIDALLDRFIPAGVARKDPATAWALAGPEMRNGSSLAAWKRGDTPVPYYPAKELNYHHWKAIDVEKDAAILNILVHPQDPKKLGTWVFSIQTIKQGGRWVVNRIYTIAVMNPPERPATVTHELGPADYAAPGSSPRHNEVAKPHHVGILPIVGILALVLMIPLVLGIVAFRRHRRWQKTVRESGRTELPPLPSTYRREREEDKELASHS